MASFSDLFLRKNRRLFLDSKIVLTAALLMFLQSLAFADDGLSVNAPTFDIARVSYINQKVSDSSTTFNGFSLMGSKQLSQHAFVGASYGESKVVDRSKSKQAYLYFGLLNHVERLPNTVIALQLGYRKASLSSPQEPSISEGAGSMAISLRNRTYDRVELRGDLEYIDWEQSQSGFAGEFGLAYFFTRSFTVDFAFRKQGELQSFSTGIAWYFE